MTLILGRHDIGAAVDLDAVLDLLADVPAYTVKVNAKFPAAAPALRGVAAPPSRPSVYSPVGLPWQDLALSWATTNTPFARVPAPASTCSPRRLKTMTYRRSAGSPRGEARRRELLDLVTEDLAVNGLVDFSLRRAARAAGTTHKVLLYHFDSAEDLLERAVGQLRERRISRSLGAAADEPTLAGRVRALWPVLTSGESWVLDQAIGLAIYDADRHGGLARGGTQQYLPALVSLCPAAWAPERKAEVAAMILATLRGFLIDLRTSGGDPVGVEAGFVALGRALDREEAAE